MNTKAFCLTLRQFPERTAAALAEFKKCRIAVEMFNGISGHEYGLKSARVEPIDGKPYDMPGGYVAMNVSHYMLWETLMHLGGDEFLIFEDDVVLPEDFQARFAKHRAALPDDWQIAFMGWDSDGLRTTFNDLTIQQRWFWGTHAYLVKREALPVLMETNHICSHHIDTQIIRRTLEPGHLRWYNFFPSLVSQRTIMKEWPSSAYEPDASVLLHRGNPPYIVYRRVNGEGFNFIIGTPDAAAWYDNRNGIIGNLFDAVEKGMLKPGDLALDAGAHQGLYALIMARKVGSSGRVLAFEPVERHYRFLQANAAINCPNIETFRSAFSDYTGLASFDQAGSRIAEGVSEKVQCFKLDDLSIQPDFMKIDIEGAEVLFFRGAKRTIKDHRPNFVVEFHHNVLGDGGFDDLMNAVDWTGYETWSTTFPNVGVQPWKPGDRLSFNADIFARRS